MILRAKFDRARDAVLVAMAKRDELQRALEYRYGGEITWATPAEKKRLERLRAAYDRASDRMYRLLEASPRDWSRGVPAYWVATQLTYDDAVRPTSEPLSVEPPKAYGW